jgi:thymidylate synthase
MVAHVTGLLPGEFVHTLGDAHLYLNHLTQVNEQISRTPYPLPTLRLNPERNSLFDFIYDDIEILNYQAHAHIKGKVSV